GRSPNQCCAMHSLMKSLLLRPAVVPSATAFLHLSEHTVIWSEPPARPEGRLDGEDDSGAALACGPSCIMSPEPCWGLGVPWSEACAKAAGDASTKDSAAAANSVLFMDISPLSATLTAQRRVGSRAEPGNVGRVRSFA